MSGLQGLSVYIGETYCVINDIVILPELQHLLIDESSEAGPGRLTKFFANLEVPILCDLTLKYLDVAERAIDLPRSIGAIDKLTRLDISCEMSSHNQNTQNLLKFLSLLSHVEEFHLLHDFGVTQQFISGLTVSSTVWRLPCLRILDIEETSCEASIEASLPAIFDMLESRYNVISEDGVESEGSKTAGTARSSMTYFLEKVSVPRWLYLQKEARWKDICNALHVECGVTLYDMDEDEDEEEETEEENAEEAEEEMVSETTS